MITAQQAHDLAITYKALCDELDSEQRYLKAHYAEKLLGLQEATGVKLIPTWALKHTVALED